MLILLYRYTLMLQCWSTNPSRRPSFSSLSNIMAHLAKDTQVSQREMETASKAWSILMYMLYYYFQLTSIFYLDRNSLTWRSTINTCMPISTHLNDQPELTIYRKTRSSNGITEQLTWSHGRIYKRSSALLDIQWLIKNENCHALVLLVIIARHVFDH